ncbi:MAG: hypothetical protein KDA63_09570, partial [Planctomycetales bacterium]|nr:hypothetical protein [Planctomycetales bacterium]
MSTHAFIALLLATTFATVGIATVLVVRLRWHWFFRCCLVVVLLAPLLAAGAPEVFLTLLLEAGTIAAGLTAVTWRHGRGSDAPLSARFSLQTLVLATVLAGGLLAV